MRPLFEISAHTAPKIYRTKEYQMQHLDPDRYKKFDKDFLKKRLDLFRKLDIHWFNTWANSDVYTDNKEEVELAQFLEDYLTKYPDLKMSSLHFVGSVYESEPEKEKQMKEQMCRIVEMFQGCKPKSIVVHPGVFGEGGSKCNIPNYHEACKKLGKDKVMDIVASNFRYFGEIAGKYNINIAIENIYGGRVYSRIEEITELVRRVDLPNVGYCLDVGHANADGLDIPEIVRLWKDKLFELHLHDNHGQDSHYPIGFGNINWIEFIKALQEIQYEGTATFEFFRWPLDDIEEGLREAILTWRVFEKLASTNYHTYDYI